MVAEMYDISTFTARGRCARLGDHRLPNGPSQDVQAADKVGVGGVAAPHAREHLIDSAGLRPMTTGWTLLRGVRRIYFHSLNTVQASFPFDPAEHVGVGPGGEGLAKLFRSSGLLALLEVLETLHGNELQLVPRKLVESTVDELIPSSASTTLALASRLPSANAGNHSSHLGAVHSPVACSNELVQPDVESKGAAFRLVGKIQKLNPHREPVAPRASTDRSSRLELRSRHGKQLPQMPGAFQRKIDAVSRAERGDPKVEVEGTLLSCRYEFCKLLREGHSAPEHGAAGHFSKSAATRACSRDNPEGMLKCMTTHSERQVPERDRVLRLLVEAPSMLPHVVNVGVHGCTVSLQDGRDPRQLLGRRKLQRESMSSNHNGILCHGVVTVKRLVDSSKRHCSAQYVAGMEN